MRVAPVRPAVAQKCKFDRKGILPSKAVLQGLRYPKSAKIAPLGTYDSPKWGQRKSPHQGGGGSKLFGGQASVSGAWLRFLVYAFLQSRMVPTLWSYRYGDTKCSLQDKADALARQAAATHLLHLRLCVLRRPRKPLASLETRNVRPRGDDVAQQLPGQATLQTETMRLVAGRESGMLLSCR